MRKFVAVLSLFACCLPYSYGQKTRFGPGLPKAKPEIEYPINVHISEIHVRTECGGPGLAGAGYCNKVAYAEVEMNGKKLELMGAWILLPSYDQFPLHPGDFHARLLKDVPKASETPIDQEYELVFPDRTVWRCAVSGFSE
jgi:hypothetical protein